MEVKSILGDYDAFFSGILNNLATKNIVVDAYPMSHLGYKAQSVEEYESVRDRLLPYSESMVENVHNGRPIAKIILKQPLALEQGFSVSLMEIMPPKNSQAQKDGLEHCGFVVGSGLKDFEDTYKDVLTGIQDQGPYCQPAFIVFDDDTRVKFYEYGLKEVVELEGNSFEPLQST
jgi:predicted metalloenzyme YecM